MPVTLTVALSCVVLPALGHGASGPVPLDDVDVVVVVARVVVVVARVVVVVARVVVVVARDVVVLVGPVVALVVVVVPDEEPVHVVPFNAKLEGTALDEVHEPWKPKAAVPFVAIEGFQLAFLAVTEEPLCEIVAFHPLTTLCPEGKVQVRVQEDTASPRFVTVTSPMKPPDHWDDTL